MPRGGATGRAGGWRKTKPVKVVFGPGTFLNESVGQIADEFAQTERAPRRPSGPRRAARQARRPQGRARPRRSKLGDAGQASSSTPSSSATTCSSRCSYGLTRARRSSTTRASSRSIVFDPTAASRTPKARFAYIFPTKDSALIQVRLRPDLGRARAREAIGLIREAVAMPDWRLTERQGHVRRHRRAGRRQRPDRLDHATRSLVLLVAALVVMAITLGDRVPRAAAAAAARRRARRRGDHLRRRCRWSARR